MLKVRIQYILYLKLIVLYFCLFSLFNQKCIIFNVFYIITLIIALWNYKIILTAEESNYYKNIINDVTINKNEIN